MRKLEISINDTIDNPEEIRPLIEEFERQQKTVVDIQIFDWDIAWTEIMKISLFRHGPVVSETGDTWMGSLAGQNSLRAFKKDEVDAIGGTEVFLGEMWQSCLDFDGENILAIPWLLDTYLVFYRRDLLEKAGVDAASAFATSENFMQTLEKLQQNGVRNPLAIPTGGNFLSIMHNASSYVWESGGDFISTDGRQVFFTNPSTLAGLRNYFELYRFLSPASQSMNDTACLNAFSDGETAITLRYPPSLHELKRGRWPKQLTDVVGMAAQPGIPFIGGSNLIIWKHIPPEQEKSALELIRYLTSTETMALLFQKTGLIPARLAALDQIESDPLYAPVIQSFKTGRAYKRIPMWGLVEDKLNKALNNIWQKIFSTPTPDIDRIILETLTPLEERLNITLSP